MMFGQPSILLARYEWFHKFNHWKLEVNGIPGDSGGIIITKTGLLVGIYSICQVSDITKKLYFGSCVKFADVIMLLNEYREKLVNKRY